MNIRHFRRFIGLFLLIFVPTMAQCGGGGKSDDDMIQLGTRPPEPKNLATISVAPFYNGLPGDINDCLPCGFGENASTVGNFENVVIDEDTDRNSIFTQDCTLSNPTLLGADVHPLNKDDHFTNIYPVAPSMQYRREGSNTCRIVIYSRAKYTVNSGATTYNIRSYTLWVTLNRSEPDGTIHGYISRAHVTYYPSAAQPVFMYGTGAPEVTIKVKGN